MLRTLYLELKSRCNLRCPYCFNSSNEGPIRAHTDEALLLILRKAREWPGVGELVLSGGELMLHPSWQWVIDQSRALGLQPALITNGIAMTDPMARFLAERCVHVCVSPGGTNEPEDAPLRGRGRGRGRCEGWLSLATTAFGPGCLIRSTAGTSVALKGQLRWRCPTDCRGSGLAWCADWGATTPIGIISACP
jgi:hypothetical protein